MKVITAMDTDGHFRVLSLSDRQKLWKYLKEECEDGDFWANIDVDNPVETFEHFSELNDDQVVKWLYDIYAIQRGRMEVVELGDVRPVGMFHDIEVSEKEVMEDLVKNPPVFVRQVETEAYDADINEVDVCRKWRKTALAFAMAYPDWFGPANGMIGSDIVEEGIHLLDMLRSQWINHIVSVNPNPNLCIEVQIEREGWNVAFQVSRSGLHYRFMRGDVDINDVTTNDYDGLNLINKAWRKRPQ